MFLKDLRSFRPEQSNIKLNHLPQVQFVDDKTSTICRLTKAKCQITGVTLFQCCLLKNTPKTMLQTEPKFLGDLLKNTTRIE